MTDNITLPREVIVQAVKVLSPMAYDTWPRERNEVVEALRTALAAEPTKPKPVAWVDCNWQWDDKEWTPLYADPPAAAPEPEPESKTPAWWMDGLTATLMREGVNKHRAREIAVGYWEAYCQIPGTEEDKT